MKKNVLFIIVFSVISYALGSYIEKESQLEVKRQALAAAAKYMDSVQKIDNNLKVAYKEVPYSKDIERPGTKINRNGYVPDAQTAVRMAVSVWSSLNSNYLDWIANAGYRLIYGEPTDLRHMLIYLDDYVWDVIIHSNNGEVYYIRDGVKTTL